MQPLRSAAGRSPEAPHHGPHPVVLIVDDEPTIRALLSRALAADGYELLLAGTAVEALELVVQAALPVNVAVIDLHLAGTDGVDLARLLRRMQPGLTVLFTSGYGETEQARVPRDPLLPKPFPPATVAQCVRDLLATGRCRCCERLAEGA
jgi:CheY-like chemotaxis protein